MKRLNGNFDGESENSGLKRGRFVDGVGGSSRALEESEGDKEERVFTENCVVDSSKVNNNEEFFGNIFPNSFEGSYLDGLEEANKWEFDLNLGLFNGNGEEQTGIGFDLNIPVFGIEDCCTGKSPVINEKRVQIINVESDDSDSDNDEVKFLGCNISYEAKGKQKVEMPSDNWNGNLNLDFGMAKMDNVVGTSSSLMDFGERRYTREEKGKSSITIHPWLSLRPDSPIEYDFFQRNHESFQRNQESNVINELQEEVELALPAMINLAEEQLRINELAMRRRAAMTCQTLKETAKRFARINHPDENKGVESSTQNQGTFASKPLESLGTLPGPFSEAGRRIRERTSRRDAEKLIEWRTSIENRDYSITAPLVPSLLDLSLKALAENAEDIVSLELIPDILRKKLVDVLCDTGKMNARTLELLVKGCPDVIRIKNCSWLTEKQFQQSLGNCETKDLRVLQLDLCGQCMFDTVLKDMLARSENSFSSLSIISFRGACRLSDNGFKELLMSAPKLRSVNLGQCTLITSDAINFIADYLGSNLRELYVDDCQKINAMLIVPAIKKFPYLEVLSVAGIKTVNDQFISEVVPVFGQSSKELDLANCTELTDCALKSIGNNCPGLSSLNISNLDKLTDLGMEYLANGCRSIQKLKLSRNGFSDEAIAAFLEASGESLEELLLNYMSNVGPNTAFSLAKRSRKLKYLDLSWCRKITNEALCLIVDSCSSLKLLKVFGCRQISSAFLNRHSNPVVRIIGLNLTPILDHLTLVEPEDVFLRYSALPVCTEA
ncbi:hypothetical protein ACJIZ3_023200 [Penstemon smallii]|uniref:F-box/LRR-repeat protein 15-like leucin rich repeat domain-containing protein n=1 Tax=Penstemon smallii TaxID=265156 RepID=A0ABD3TNG9_9LAMI